MKTKYAKLIERLESANKAYTKAVQDVKNYMAAIDDIDDVFGVNGAVFFMDGCDADRSFHIASRCFAQAAIDCGTDFKMKHLEYYTQFECSMFGYRVFALFQDDDENYEKLMKRVVEK